MSGSAGAGPPSHDETNVRPVVRTATAGKWGPWAFGIGLAILALLLFQALDSRRRAAVAPSTTIPLGSAEARIVSPPPLGLPSRFDDDELVARPYLVRRTDDPFDRRGLVDRRAQVVTRIVERPPPRMATSPPPPAGTAPPPAPAFLPPASQPYPNRPPPPPPGAATPNADAQPSAGRGADRVRASRLSAPGFTVPQATVIAAVLETALDSTKPGFARALVSRDVLSFDGTRVLIPRGSRLFGEYDASLEPGQNRALIRWMRLTRPDGVRMELDSPSADALGRAGVRGKVDTKFLQRFGGAILQSVLDIGVGLATRPVRDRGVIVALPGSSQVVNPAQQTQVKPTLRVKQGSRVTVFVARDLDFSDVDQ